jgi:putative ABC transport system substrate-binding protein
MWRAGRRVARRLTQETEMGRIQRRQVVVGAALAWSAGGALAQAQDRVWRVACIAHGGGHAGRLQRFREEMRDLGYAEGRNLLIEYRTAGGNSDRMTDLLAELLRWTPDVLLAFTTPAVLAAKKATTTVPVVATGINDPVFSGVVSNLARPDANITGVATLAGEVTQKQVELLLTLLPKMTKVGVLVNPSNVATSQALLGVQQAGRARDIGVVAAEATNPAQIDAAIAHLSQQGVDAVVIAADAYLIARERQIADLAVRNGLPSIEVGRQYCLQGGLMSYGYGEREIWPIVASYVDRIFKGARPAELPFQQPTRLNLVINLKAADALRITLPQELLTRADEIMRAPNTADWIDITDPLEVRALTANRTFKGRDYYGVDFAIHYRGDGNALRVAGGTRIPMTWEVGPAGEICRANRTSDSMATGCFRLQRHKADRTRLIERHAIADWNVEYTVEDGIPQF